MITVRHILISPLHAYVKHPKYEPGPSPMTDVEAVECLAGRGLKGDRFCDYEADYCGQVTFFSWEVFEAMRRELSKLDATPHGLRRNVFTQGVNLNELIGKTFAIQGIRFEGTEEAAPCGWMDHAYGAGTRDWLKDRGGLRARILDNGILRRDALGAPRAKTSGEHLAAQWPEHEWG